MINILEFLMFLPFFFKILTVCLKTHSVVNSFIFPEVYINFGLKPNFFAFQDK